MTKFHKHFNDEAKKINKDKKLDLNKEMNSVLEQKNLLTILVDSKTKINFINQASVIQ